MSDHGSFLNFLPMPLDAFKNTIDMLRAFDFGAAQEKAVEDNVDELPAMVREQLAGGEDGDGNDNTIFGRDTYAPKTIEIKKEKGVGLGAVTNYITNYMTGQFYETVEVKMENGAFELKSDVPYFEEIKQYSSSALLEVSEEHRLEFAEDFVMPSVENDLLQETGLVVTHK